MSLSKFQEMDDETREVLRRRKGFMIRRYLFKLQKMKEEENKSGGKLLFHCLNKLFVLDTTGNRGFTFVYKMRAGYLCKSLHLLCRVWSSINSLQLPKTLANSYRNYSKKAAVYRISVQIFKKNISAKLVRITSKKRKLTKPIFWIIFLRLYFHQSSRWEFCYKIYGVAKVVEFFQNAFAIFLTLNSGHFDTQWGSKSGLFKKFKTESDGLSTEGVNAIRDNF